MEFLAKSAAAALLIGMAWACLVLPAQGQSGGEVEYFLTLKSGQQDPSNSGDTAIDSLEQDDGPLQDTRTKRLLALELDVLVFPNPRYGAGLGLEIHNYRHVLHFSSPGQSDAETLELLGLAMLYDIKWYVQTGPLLNYLGMGSGIYYLVYKKQGDGRVYRNTSEDVFSLRVGTRIEFDRWSLLLEHGNTRARYLLPFRPDRPELEVGGRFTKFGLGYAF